jgi:hypothetical protein
VLPDPPSVRPLTQVAPQVLDVHLPPVREVLGHLDRGLLERGERLVAGHEVDDAVDALVLEAVTDVDQRDRDGELRSLGREREAHDAAQRRADEGGLLDAEVAEHRRNRVRQRPAVQLVDGIGVAVARQIGREHVVRRCERGTELLPHVRGLATAVQADDGPSGARTPFEVVDLTAVDEREAAAAARGDIVTRREEVELCVGRGHAPLPCPSSHAALSR